MNSQAQLHKSKPFEKDWII